MKNFTIVIEAAVQDLDEDVIRTIPRAITQRFDGTAVTVKNVNIVKEGEGS
jgi:hypothetical protein